MSMRIATSTIYDNQINAIDNLSAQYENIGQELSTGISLNAPGDDPQVVAQDLTLKGTIAAENGDVSNMSAAQNQMNFVDSTLNSLTDILQEARSLAISSATNVIPNGVQRQEQGSQVQGMLEDVINLANSQYGQKYIFAGTSTSATPPITPQGNPPNSFIFTGNLQTQYEDLNGQQVAVGTTMQQAFNLNASDGTPSVFDLLANLRDTMNASSVVDQSGQAVNAAGNYISGNTLLSQLEAGAPALSTIALQPDSNGMVSFTINGVDPATGLATSNQFTFNPAVTTVDDVVNAINASVPPLGVQAAWNVQSQTLSLTSTNDSGQGTFQINDASSPGPPAATNTANFVEVFGLQTQADVVNNLSQQIGQIDSVLNAVLQTRASLGTTLQSVAAQSTQISSQSVDNTNIESGYEDTNVGYATSRFTQLQTALQGAYAVTTRLESKTLMDYIA